MLGLSTRRPCLQLNTGTDIQMYFAIFVSGATVYQTLCILVATETVVYYIKKYVQKTVSKDVIANEDIVKIL